ncbi:DUF2249 domain-containing protein [Mesorhizobium sp. M00.F.Ca.ET.216.01.1.1]|uniref:DUF2249 domain-containing protein n=1 Tax=Mesorhizobium sp. M00.F.Ca.ET.216.01.1.1 TaxID=2500528 RepID=UPI000FDA7192|nr:DUF2249 domain-containing protein [Mesorhizobium sp. M00.F.Ca.ET.216.01.1.1]TGQ31459.1 DUF2249 domain-containing protein [Mesorhizobium sp. M00.F.Ca.ET.216.01.1.1]
MNFQKPTGAIYDVRRLPSERKQSAVLSMFDGLRPSQTFTVVLDFDPDKLKRQFEAFFAGEHIWVCLKPGPPEWLIEIARPQSAR